MSEKKKNDTPKKLVWMDLEMTGLDSDRDVIIEMATLITDVELNVIAEGPEIVIRRSQELFETMDSWNREHHTKSGLWAKVVSSEVSQDQAEQMTIEFIKQHVGLRESPLCGNSIWQDRRFIAKHMKNLDAYLHYRLVDVSSVKLLGKIWYPAESEKSRDKKSAHRALDDIKESIEELKLYRQLIFK
ncbi:MAG: oligoribonuclease [Pseudomonadota bacterium]